MTEEKKSAGKNLLVWAFDPFEEISDFAGRNLLAMARDNQNSEIEIQPVYVVPLPKIRSGKEGASRVVKAQEKIRIFFASLPAIKNLRSAEIITNFSGNQKESVGNLIDYAEANNATAIIVSAHGKSALSQLFFGSFAEALLRDSTLPVLFLERKKKWETSKTVNTVLFPTDFSDTSARAFRRFLSYAKKSGFKIMLFHSAALPPSMYTSMASVYIPDDFFRNQVRDLFRQSKKWTEEAQKRGVETEVIILDNNIVGSAAADIMRAATERQVRMLVLATASNFAERMLVGSVAFELFRAGKIPIWAYGPKAVKRSPAKRGDIRGAQKPFKANRTKELQS
jgi:nucleotide-binding universal stress UspA family protein